MARLLCNYHRNPRRWPSACRHAACLKACRAKPTRTQRACRRRCTDELNRAIGGGA